MGWNWGGAASGAGSGAAAGSSFGPIGTVVGGAAGGLFGGFSKDPTKEANKYLKQIPGMGKQYYNPFIERGARAGNMLEGEYGKLLEPTSFIDEIMKHYKTSAGAEYNRDKLGRGIGATAAAGGFAGTPEHQQEYGEMADKIMSQDMQEYLQNALGVYNRGLGGEEGFNNQGFDASKDLVDLLGGTLSSQAGVAYKGASQSNEDRQAMMNAISKAFNTRNGVNGGKAPFS